MATIQKKKESRRMKRSGGKADGQTEKREMTINDLIPQTRVEPRPYQKKIIERVAGAFCDQNLRSVLIESPTGSGKTVMGLLAARLLQERLGLRIGWVAMRRNLLTQAAAENSDMGINAEISWISMFDKEPPTDLDMLVVDEAQHDGASSMTFLHSVIQPRFILGLSATPFRADKVKLCFDTVVKEATIHRLIQDGYLSQYNHFTIPAYKPETVADMYCQDKERWGKSIMYFHTLNQCNEAAEALRRNGVKADIVTGSSNRDAQLDAFREGRTEVLLNCMVLAEGFNCPDIKTVFCRPSCKGVTIQMCGRVLRLHHSLPTKQIVQCQKTRWPFVRTAKPAQQYVRVEDEWRSLEVNPQINQVTVKAITAIARADVELPKFLTGGGATERRRRERQERRENRESA